jgi:transcriptional regulator with XRE-family HTH domain
MLRIEDCLVLPTIEDIRGARAFLGWDQKTLSEKTDLNTYVISSLETKRHNPTKETLGKIVKVFLEEGIHFLAGGGFKLQKNLIQIYEGQEGWLQVLDDIKRTCGADKKEVLYWGNDDKRSSDKVNEKHKVHYNLGIPYRFLIEKNNDFILGPLEEYRKIDKKLILSKDVVTIYGDKIAFFAEEEGDLENYILTKVKIIILDNKGLAEQFRAYFNNLWNDGKPVVKSSTEQIFFREKKKHK